MSDQDQNFPNSSDNIELLYYVRKAISFIKGRWKFYSAFFLGGILAGILIFISSKPVFTSSMSAYSWSLDDNRAVGLISDLSTLIEFKDYEQLSQKIKMRPETIEQIVSLKVKREKPEGEVVYEDKERKFGFLISVKVFDTKVLDSLEEGLKYYIENTQFVENRLSAYKAELSYNISKTTKEIEDLSNLKNNLNNMLTAKQSTQGSNIFLSDIGKTSTNLLELHEKLIKQKEEIQMVSDFTVIKKFTKYKKRSSPRLSYSLMIGVAFSMFLSILISCFPFVRNFIKSC